APPPPPHQPPPHLFLPRPHNPPPTPPSPAPPSRTRRTTPGQAARDRKLPRLGRRPALHTRPTRPRIRPTPGRHATRLGTMGSHPARPHPRPHPGARPARRHPTTPSARPHPHTRQPQVPPNNTPATHPR